MEDSTPHGCAILKGDLFGDNLDVLQELEDAIDLKRTRESIEDSRENGGTKSLEEFREELEKSDARIRTSGAIEYD